MYFFILIGQHTSSKSGDKALTCEIYADSIVSSLEADVLNAHDAHGQIHLTQKAKIPLLPFSVCQVAVSASWQSICLTL